MIPQGGYIKLFRKIQDHPWSIYEPACKQWAWIDLLLLAAYESHEVQVGKEKIHVERGDIVASIRFLAKRWKWGNQKTMSFLAQTHADNQLIKKRNGSGNGSPSIYHIVNYDIYQGDTMSNLNGLENAHRTVTERLPNETKKGKKGKKEDIPSGTWKNYSSGFSVPEQEVLLNTAEAIAHTRKINRVSPSILDKLACDMSRYPNDVVLRSCQIYLEKNYMAEGKGEKYLLGIVRGEFKRNGNNGAANSGGIQEKTEGQLAIERAERAMHGEARQEQEPQGTELETLDDL